MKWRLLIWATCLLVVSRHASGKDLPELCPCLPADLCPRAYGASMDDQKYLGEFMKCAKDTEVRCCGASMSQEVNLPTEEVKGTSAEEDQRYLRDNEIEDVRLEHLTIPPSVEEMTTTEAPQEDELPMTTTMAPEEEMTTTISDDILEATTLPEEDMITTEAPVVEVTPRFGKNVQFVYAVSPEEYFGSQRKAKKLSFGASAEEEEKESANDVFVIMPQTFLVDEAANEIEANEPTATTPAPADDVTTTTVEPEQSGDEVTMIPTTTQGQTDGDDEEITMPTTTEMPTTTKRPLIRKRIRVKVRRGFKLLPKLSEKDLQLELDSEHVGDETTRRSRNLEEAPKPKINHALYARRRSPLLAKSIGSTTTEAPEVAEAVAPETTVAPPAPVTKQSPAALKILKEASVGNRRNLFHRRTLKSPEKPAAVVANKLAVETSADNTKKIQGRHQKMIEQVAKAVGQESMMSTFDVADDLMDPKMAAQIARIQKMLADEIMEQVMTRIKDQLQGKPSTTTATEEAVIPENPIDCSDAKEAPMPPFRGGKRFIETNFLNAYENVIHKVEDKIKSHKGPIHRPHPTKIITTTTERPVSSTPPAHHVQILLSTTPTSVTENSEELDTITEIIERLDDIERLEFSDADALKPALGLDANSKAPEDQSDQLSEPIDLLARRRRNLRGARRFSLARLFA